MQERSRTVLLIALLYAGCEEDPETSLVDSSTPDAALDAGGDSSLDGALDGAGDGSLDAHTDATLLDANLQPDAGDAAVDAAWPPSAPVSFRIGVSGSTCYGDCSDYSVALDQSGKVTFFGGICAARPGAFTKQVAAADARMLYDALAATQFWSLGERYLDESDGCPMVWTDNPTYTWKVEIDGRSKMLAHDNGCQGLPELERIDALEALAIQLSGVESWIRPAPFNCGAGRPVAPYGFPLEPAYRLSYGQQVLGVLVLDGGAASWTLNDCAGARLLEGKIIFDAARWSLLDRDRHSIQLPGAGEVGSIVLDKPEGDAPPRVRALRADDELVLSATEASGC